MTTPPLEDRLTRLADGLVAPATPEARYAIGHRTGVLRRRRRAMRAAGSGVLVLAVIGGIALTRPDPTPEAEVAGAQQPAFSLEVPGWDIVAAEDEVTLEPVAPPSGSEQVFARPDDPEGAQIVLHHSSSSDAFGPPTADEEPVQVGTVEGRLTRPAPDEVILRWQPPLGGDNTAEIEARGLASDEVIAVADGLQAKDEDPIEFPASPDHEFGFVPTYLPEGMQEEEPPAAEPTGGVVPGRHLVAETDTATAELTVTSVDDPARQAEVTAASLSGGPPEEVSVLGRPARLVPRPDLEWSLIWEPADGAERGARGDRGQSHDARRARRRPARDQRGQVGRPGRHPRDALIALGQPGGTVSPGANRQRVASCVKSRPPRGRR